MHHRQSIAEHVHDAQAALFKDVGAPDGFEEGEPEEQVDVWHQVERMAREVGGVPYGGVAVIVRQPDGVACFEEVLDEIQPAITTSRWQRPCGRAGAGC